jgi:hypothetical protein
LLLNCLIINFTNIGITMRTLSKQEVAAVSGGATPIQAIGDFFHGLSLIGFVYWSLLTGKGLPPL